MYIAQKLRKTHVTGYILYMFQVEDVIRAYGMQIDKLRTEYLPRFNFSAEQEKEVAEWYEHLINMMREEGIKEKGHLQVVQNTLLLIADRHRELLDDPKAVTYQAAYRKALPCIVELRAHGANRDANETENCLEALYGAAILKMKGSTLRAATEEAIKPIAQLMELLSAMYNNDNLS